MLSLPNSAPERVMLAPREEGAPAPSAENGAMKGFESLWQVPVQDQVRIERRMIIRVAPRQLMVPQGFADDLTRQEMPVRFVEGPTRECLPIKSIAGVQVDKGNRLILFMRNRNVIGASLEKSCRARDFYSGFYVERSEDGRICARRDRLQSRSGASCEVRNFRRLVPAGG